MLNEIQRTENVTYLVAGIQVVNLTFSGPTIYFYGVNGPYQVNLGLFNTTTGMLLDTDAHITGAYLWTDFESPAPFTAPWYDDFESGSLGGTTGYNWSTTDVAFSGVATYTAHSGIYSMYTESDPVTVTSWLVDLSSMVAAEVRVWIQRGSDTFSEDPDFGEDLVLEYLNDVAAWITLETFPGDGTPGEVIQRTYSLPADALHAGFRLRFTQIWGSGGGSDYWHIDDVYVSLRRIRRPLLMTTATDCTTG
jgi:hypothetical protein